MIFLVNKWVERIKFLGRGEFGDVMVAKISKSVLSTPVSDKRNSTTSTGPTDEKEIPVLVKSLSQTKDDNSLAEIKREIDIFSKLSHENITKMHGLCREAEPHYMILEYTDWVNTLSGRFLSSVHGLNSRET